MKEEKNPLRFGTTERTHFENSDILSFSVRMMTWPSFPFWPFFGSLFGRPPKRKVLHCDYGERKMWEIKVIKNSRRIS